MWGPLYLGVGAMATALTWAFAVREQAVVFTAAMASVAWALLALQNTLTLATDTGTQTIAVGPARYLFAALGLLSLVALTGSLLGQYPTDSPDPDFEVQS